MANFNLDMNTLYLIYDDECPMCHRAAHALRIKQAIGNLVLINGREDHPLVHMDPEHGIVVIYHDKFYYAADALYFLSMLNSSSRLINKSIAYLFRKKWIVYLTYPILTQIRNFLLAAKGVGHIETYDSSPLFSRVLGDDWHTLPKVLQRLFSNKTYSNDVISVTGQMTIKSSRWFRFITPLFNLTQTIIIPAGENIPVSVKYQSEKHSARYWFMREFGFKPPIKLNSYLLHIKNNRVVEYMLYGIGLRTDLFVIGNAVEMRHAGYVLRCFRLLIPIPLALLIGKCHLTETALSDDSFSLDMHLQHFLFGKIYEYKGIFTLQ